MASLGWKLRVFSGGAPAVGRDSDSKRRSSSRKSILLDINHLRLIVDFRSDFFTNRCRFNAVSSWLIVSRFFITRSGFDAFLSWLIVSSHLVRLCLGAIQHDAEHAIARQLFEQAFDDRITGG